MKQTLIALLTLLMLLGCSRDLEEYNKPALYWYQKMITHIADNSLEKADDYYSSLQSEHIGSPLLPEATLMMAHAHMIEEEYLLTEHFLNEYIRRYATPPQREYAEYLKVKAKYLSLPRPRRDQGMVHEAIKAGESFKQTYPYSSYTPQIETMLTRLYLSAASLNETIASLYERLDKPKASAYYRSLKPVEWVQWSEVEPANGEWFRRVFEGDGEPSWYAFLIPDTRSVVSRRYDDNDTQ